MLRRAAYAGGRDALAALGLPQPSLGSVGIKLPKAGGLPSLKAPSAGSTGSLGADAAKAASAYRGEPADTGRRPQSAIDRAFQAFDDRGATSSMPEPGAVQP